MDSLSALLKDTIASRPEQWMSLAEWMDAVLYHPRWGYYMRDRKKIGKDGDYYTSSALNPLFGEVLAEALCGFVTTLPPACRNIVELGGGEGRLAAAVLDALQQRPDVYETLTYYMVEKSPYHRRLQQDVLARHADKVVYVEHVQPLAPFFGVVFSNEFFDALPVHALVARDGQWMEVGVTWDDELRRFVEKCVRCQNARLLAMVDEWGVRPTADTRLEISLEAASWMEQLAKMLDTGYVLTIDYGYFSEDGTCRPDGTVRGFQAHRLMDDVWEHPGQQDVTADVNFTLLVREGKKSGLKPLWLETQRDFLLRWGILEELTDGATDPWSPEARKNRMIRQIVFDETGMGSRFLVLVQAKNVRFPSRLQGVKRSYAWHDIPQEMLLKKSNHES